jgi:hypothetical protein
MADEEPQPPDQPTAPVRAGDVYGELTILELVPASRGTFRVVCACSCGGRRQASTRDVTSGRLTSCGCRKLSGMVPPPPPSREIVVGDQIGRWTVVRPAEPKAQRVRVVARCECGTEREMYASQLRGKRPSQSCGCWTREIVASANRARKGQPVVVPGETLAGWRVESRAEIGANNQPRFLCRCVACARPIITTSARLRGRNRRPVRVCARAGRDAGAQTTRRLPHLR